MWRERARAATSMSMKHMCRCDINTQPSQHSPQPQLTARGATPTALSVNLTYIFSNVCDIFRSAARNTFYLKKVGVTHVLNTAEGQTSGTVDTNQKFYKPFNIQYKGLKLLDVSQANISIHFTEISEFIDSGLQGGGKVGGAVT